MRLLTASLLALAAFLVAFGGSLVTAHADEPMTQEWFLQHCEEDEVIGFVEGNFDGVECIHRDEL